MISRVVPAHSVTNLRTLRGRSQISLPAYKAYLRVSFLELERARHSQEIGAARGRLDRMLDRCREIEREKAAILSVMGESSAATVATPAAVRTLRGGRRQFAVNY